MTLPLLTPALILLPMASAVLMVALSGRNSLARNLQARQVAGVAMGLQAALVGWFYVTWSPSNVVQTVFESPWLPALGTMLSLSLDAISVHALVVLSAVSVIAIVAELYMESRLSVARLALIFVVVAALNLLLLSGDLLCAAVAHGVAGLALAALLGVGCETAGHDAARRFASWSVAGTLLLSAAAAAVAAGAETTVVADLVRIAPGTTRLAAPLLLAALAMQIPLVPLHTWLAPVAVAGSHSGRVLVLGGWCLVGAAALLRFGLGLFPDLLAFASPVPMLWGIATVAYAGLLSLAQAETDFAHRLSWATVGTGGMLLVGVAGLETLPVLGGWLYAAGQALPRVAMLLLAHWLTVTGARSASLGVLWGLLALSLAAAPGLALFPGWLLISTGTSAAVAVGLLLGTAVIGFALLAPTIHLLQAPRGPSMPAFLSRSLVLVLALMLLSGMFPLPTAAVGDEVERLLDRVAHFGTRP